MRGKLATVIDQIEHGHHVFRAYFKHAFLKQYEKFSTFLRNELCSNNLNDFGLKKGLDHLDAVREKFQAITDRFAGFQAQWLNVHVDFPLLQRLALPITIGSVRYPGIKIHETRIIRLMEVLLHGGTTSAAGRPSRSTKPSSPPSTFPRKAYRLNQLRYDLRKLKGHAPCQTSQACPGRSCPGAALNPAGYPVSDRRIARKSSAASRSSGRTAKSLVSMAGVNRS